MSRALVLRAARTWPTLGRSSALLLVELAAFATDSGASRHIVTVRWESLAEVVVGHAVPAPPKPAGLGPGADGLERAAARRAFLILARGLERSGCIERIRDVRPWDPDELSVYRLHPDRWP